MTEITESKQAKQKRTHDRREQIELLGLTTWRKREIQRSPTTKPIEEEEEEEEKEE